MAKDAWPHGLKTKKLKSPRVCKPSFPILWVWTFEPLQACNALQVGPPTTKLPSSFHVIKRRCRKRQFLVSCRFHSKHITKCNFKASQIVLWVDFNNLPPESLTKAVNLGRQQWVSLAAKINKFCQIFPFFFWRSQKNRFFSLINRHVVYILLKQVARK